MAVKTYHRLTQSTNVGSEVREWYNHGTLFSTKQKVVDFCTQRNALIADPLKRFKYLVIQKVRVLILKFTYTASETPEEDDILTVEELEPEDDELGFDSEEDVPTPPVTNE